MSDRDIVIHTVSAIGRTGATGLEVGYMNDKPPHDWWAASHHRGVRFTCEKQEDPAAALLGLYAMIVAGGQCTTCGRKVAVMHERGLIERARMFKGEYQTRLAQRPHSFFCVRGYTPSGWSLCSELDDLEEDDA